MRKAWDFVQRTLSTGGSMNQEGGLLCNQVSAFNIENSLLIFFVQEKSAERKLHFSKTFFFKKLQ